MFSNRPRSKLTNAKSGSNSALTKRKIESKTVIKQNKAMDVDYFSKSSKPKPQKKSRVVEYQQKLNSKIRDEYNIKKKDKENWEDEDKPTLASQIYGERMFMSKYRNEWKFMENLNSTLSPRKEEKTLMSCTTSTSKNKLVPHKSAISIKKS